MESGRQMQNHTEKKTQQILNKTKQFTAPFKVDIRKLAELKNNKYYNI